MPRGFAGKSVKKFFANTEEALTRAGAAHSKDPFENTTSKLVPLPNLPEARNQPAPFTQEEAFTGSPHSRRVGNSTSVVVDPDVYNTVLQRMDTVDYQAGADMYMISNEIEELCATIFVVPDTVEQIATLCSQFKKELNQFRAVTEEVAISTRQYLSRVSEIDHGNTEELAFTSQGADQAIQRVSSAIERQVSSMERTVENYQSRASRLSDQAQRERARAERLAERMTMTNQMFPPINPWLQPNQG